VKEGLELEVSRKKGGAFLHRYCGKGECRYQIIRLGLAETKNAERRETATFD